METKETEYWVIQCPNCGQIQTKMINKITNRIFKCVYCRKSRKLKKVSDWGLSIKVLFRSTNPHEAAQQCSAHKAKQGGG